MCQLYKIPISTRFILSYANNVYLSRRHYFGNDSLDIAMHKQGVTGVLERIGGGHCVFKWGFTRIFPWNQDITVKFKSELIFINFLYVFNVIGNTEPICFTQTIPSMCEP